MRERGGWRIAKGPGRDTNPGLLQRGQSLCTRDACSTNWAKQRPSLSFLNNTNAEIFLWIETSLCSMCTVLYQPESGLTTCIHFCFASIYIFSYNDCTYSIERVWPLTTSSENLCSSRQSSSRPTVFFSFFEMYSQQSNIPMGHHFFF